MDLDAILQRIYEYLATYWLQVVAATVIFVVGRWIAKLISKLVVRALTKAKVEPTLTNFLKKARQVIEQVLAGDNRTLSEPPATVAVSELADSSVNFVVRPWVKTADYWDVYFNITEGIKSTLDNNGITIPYPQRDIHMKGGVS